MAAYPACFGQCRAVANLALWLAHATVAIGCTEPTMEKVRAPAVEEALAGLPRDAPIGVALETDAGDIRCALDPARTPQAVALFVGFALGRASFLDPFSHRVTKRPLYFDMPFHRAVAGALLQSGDPLGDGTGTPGFRIPVEAAADDAARLSPPGALVLARYTAPPGRADPRPPPPGHVLGSQFAVLLTPMPHLVGQLSVIGHCEDLELGRRLASDIAERKLPHRLARVRVD